MPDSGVGGNTVKLVAEAMLPGASQFVDGNIKSGFAHLVLSGVAWSLLGPLGVLLVRANSYSYSVSEKHLHNQIADLFSTTEHETL